MTTIVGQPGLSSDHRGRVRPWWGIGDALMVIPILIVVSLLAAVAVILLGDDTTGGEDADLPLWAIAVFTLVQQCALLLWPFWVSRRKGLGPAADWGFDFKLEDLGIGLGVAMIAMFSAGIAAAIAAAIVGLEEESDGENLQLLTDAEGSPWLWTLIYTVVIVAPVAEEVLFRGLILQAFKKRFGTVIAVIVSIMAFAPLHVADGGFFSGGQVVLLAAIG
ncbi:MAG: lysostaphin resistance A-like protein, partial [Actinomycetota bacterium]